MMQRNGKMPPGKRYRNPNFRHRRRRGRKRVRIYWPRFVLTLFFLAMVCFGTARLTKYLLGVRETAQVNAELAQIYEDQPRVEVAAPQQYDSPVTTLEEDTEEERPAEIESVRTFHATDGEVLDEFDALYAQNPDFTAWLKLPGVFSLPVVYRDNAYYLDHDFYGQESDSGTLFLDERHPLDAQSQYLMIHGHAMYDGSMLGYLTHYRNAEYIRAHPYLYLATKYEQEKYEIIGVLVVSEDEMISLVRLGTPRFESGTAFANFVNELRGKALHFTNQEIAEDTAILALSTCWKDGRIVVLFKRVK